MEMLTHYNATEARKQFHSVVREAVRDERPVVVDPRDEEAVVVVSRTQLLDLLTPYEVQVEIVPEEEGGYTFWVEELRIGAYGRTLPEARDKLVDEAFAYVRHFFQMWPRYKHTDRAAQRFAVARLALAETPLEMRDLLFSKLKQRGEG